MSHRLFLDETTLGGSDYFFILGLSCFESVEAEWTERFRDTKRRLAEQQVIESPNPQLHLAEIKKHGKYPWRTLADAGKRQVFWNEMTNFIRAMPFTLTAALVYSGEIRRASLNDWSYKSKIAALSAVIENAVILGRNSEVSRYSIHHDWIDDKNYKGHLEWLIGRGELRMIPAHIVGDIFDRAVNWVPKAERVLGVELTDLMATPLATMLVGGKDSRVPNPFVQEAARHLAFRTTPAKYRPFSIRLLP